MKKYNPFALKAIYFGLNMDKQYQAQIIEKLENRDVKFYKMERKDKSYLQRHLLVKNIHSSKSVWVRIERVVGFAEVSLYSI